jgi:hypothetical protein
LQIPSSYVWKLEQRGNYFPFTTCSTPKPRITSVIFKFLRSLERVSPNAATKSLARQLVIYYSNQVIDSSKQPLV